jgi:hypothetical protein
MAFLAPLAFSLLILIPLVIAMYLLKLRRTEQAVSSVYLWRRMVRDIEANAPWQKLRRNLLLLLQILFLLFLIFALSRPFTRVAGSGSQSTIIILDTSASMAATDAQPDRLEVARTQARRLVDDLPDGARVTIIAAGQSAQVLVASSQDRRQAYLAIDSLQVQPGGSNMEAALQLASAIAARQPETEIILLTDGNLDLPDRLAIAGNVRYLPVGTQGENQAISLLNLERLPGEDTLTAFAQVRNYDQRGTDPVLRRISFYLDGVLFHAQDIELDPGGQQAILVPDLPLETGIVEARLDETDHLSLDDRAWVVWRNIESAPVTLVSNGNRFLETALSLLPGVEVTVVAPEDWESSFQESADDQAANRLTIFDGYVPESGSLPAENLLFIGPRRSTALFSITGTIQSPELSILAEGDPLLANLVDLQQINVLEAAWISLPDWGQPVISTPAPEGTVPLLFRGEVEGRRVVVLAFDFRHSDLPLQISYPILLANLMHWLAPAEVDLPAQAAPGETVSFSLPAQNTSAILLQPDGRQVPLTVQDTRLITPPLNQLGVYQVLWGEDQQASFAVNLFSPRESQILPAGTLPVVGDNSSTSTDPNQLGRREWWRPFAWMALLILIIEWLVYQRANLRRLWDTLLPRIKPVDEPQPSFPRRNTR